MLNKRFISIITVLLSANLFSQGIYKQSFKLMGCNFDITIVANDSSKANQYIGLAVDEITRIENLTSSWDANSQTSAINSTAHIRPVKVDQELFDLIERSIHISKLTDGAFDISYASMDKIWQFDGSMTVMPTEDRIRASVSKVGYHSIVLNKDDSTVFFNLQGMKIGFGGIGKGYAADRAKALLIAKGVPAGIINASGDMSTWGKQPNGKEWQVAITNPLNNNKVIALLPIGEGAVVTSGNYESYVTFNGKRYSHIIDPKTGYPASGILSVSVFARQAELADALATAVFVMGKEVGLDRINQLPTVECIIIDENGDIHVSEGIRIENR